MHCHHPAVALKNCSGAAECLHPNSKTDACYLFRPAAGTVWSSIRTSSRSFCQAFTELLPQASCSRRAGGWSLPGGAGCPRSSKRTPLLKWRSCSIWLTWLMPSQMTRSSRQGGGCLRGEKIDITGGAVKRCSELL